MRSLTQTGGGRPRPGRGGAAAGHVRGAEVRSGPPHRLCHALPAAGVPGQPPHHPGRAEKQLRHRGPAGPDRGRRPRAWTGEKLRDLGLIFGAYEAMTARGPLDPRDKLTCLGGETADHPFFQGKDVYLDGFTDFTPSRTWCWRPSSAKAHSVTLALTWGEGELFSPAQKTIASVKRLAAKTGQPVAETLWRGGPGADATPCPPGGQPFCPGAGPL